MERKTTPNKRKYLSLNEIKSLLQTIRRRPHGVRNYCLALICFIHGLRASELCRLRISDIDLGARCIYIQRLKNGFSTIHPLLEEEIQALKAWLDVRTHFRHATEEWLFLSCKGNHLSRKQFHQIISTSGTIAGISLNIHPHMLRHSCGFALADQGIDTRLIQDYLGHRNIRHTVWYTASNPGRFCGIWERRGIRSSSDPDRTFISILKSIIYQSENDF
ncbi:tyrosine-type recombinase/integrase [Serratia fonticola]|uniref:tyrosine-type DNA invertase n=1 Tax=Serratia fonticola TaxID=47917 RepID=UPI0015C5B4FF|nr:tyrosine-type DNA invertase [Serratia fonticola]MBC3381677.1 tyrosine-type recombinase/integrase [Serratia fonticola]NYA40876.1 tyrosine-type recombinase/integrase [Serratia fonticola]